MKRSDFRRSDRYLVLDNDRCGVWFLIMSLIAAVVASFYVEKYRCTVLLNSTSTRCVQNYTGIFEKKPVKI
jgi:hypothetical protein